VPGTVGPPPLPMLKRNPGSGRAWRHPDIRPEREPYLIDGTGIQSTSHILVTEVTMTARRLARSCRERRCITNVECPYRDVTVITASPPPRASRNGCHEWAGPKSRVSAVGNRRLCPALRLGQAQPLGAEGADFSCPDRDTAGQWKARSRGISAFLLHLKKNCTGKGSAELNSSSRHPRGRNQENDQQSDHSPES
jgi:hypothetical protein